MLAANAARILREKGIVGTVVVRRAGSQHVPTFDVDEDRGPFEAFVATLPHTDNWDGQSVRAANLNPQLRLLSNLHVVAATR